MNETNSNPSPAQSRGRRAIVASALALALMGGVASQALLPGSIPAQAQNLSERVQQPAGVTASTTSGSGLFHSERGWMPTSAPVPTDASGGHLVKISASGPIPTSRYCDQIP